MMVHRWIYIMCTLFSDKRMSFFRFNGKNKLVRLQVRLIIALCHTKTRKSQAPAAGCQLKLPVHRQWIQSIQNHCRNLAGFCPTKAKPKKQRFLHKETGFQDFSCKRPSYNVATSVCFSARPSDKVATNVCLSASGTLGTQQQVCHQCRRPSYSLAKSVCFSARDHPTTQQQVYALVQDHLTKQQQMCALVQAALLERSNKCVISAGDHLTAQPKVYVSVQETIPQRSNKCMLQCKTI